MRTIFLILTLFALTACEGSSDDYLARAKEYLAAGDHPAAIIELKNALVQDKGSAEARWLLGKAYLDTGDIPSAEKELSRAAELGWNGDDVRPALAKALLARGKVEEALEIPYQDLGDTAAARLLSTQAMAALSDEQLERAAELVALALEKSPQLEEAALAEAAVSVKQGDTEGALGKIEKLQAQSPDNSGAQWLKGQVLLQRGELQAAREAMDESLENADDATLSDLIMRALVSVKLGDFEAAQSDARAVLRVAPGNPTANYIVGVNYFQNKEYLEAISALDLARPVAEQYPLMLYYLSSSHLIENNLGVAAEFAREFVRLVPDDANGRKLLAAILLQQGDVRQARDVVQPVIDQNPEDLKALNLKANALLLDDQVDIGMLLYARIAEVQREWPIVPLPLQEESTTSGVNEGEDTPGMPWPEGDGNFPQGDILSILNYLGSRDFDNAIKLAEAYKDDALEREPKALSPLNVLGRVYFAAGRPEEAKAVFEQVLQRKRGNPSANWSLAEMAESAGDTDAARQHYMAILKYRDEDLETLLKLAELEGKHGNREAMLSHLKQAAKDHRTAFEPRVRLAEHYMDAGEPEKIEPLFAELSPLQRRSPRVLELTAREQIARREYDGLVATTEQWIEVAPRSARAHYLLGLAANATGDTPRGKRALLQAVEIDPELVPALIALAKLARFDNEQEEFDQYLVRLVELAPEAPDVLRLRALSAYATGNELKAVELSQQVYTMAPSTRTALELASLQKAAGLDEAAYDVMEHWIEAHPGDIDARLFLANSYTLDNKVAAARGHYQAVLELDGANLTALNNLAWTLRKDNPREALDYIHRARDLAPGRTDILDTLAVIEFYNGEYTSARQNLERALAARPDNPTLRYHDAMIAAALGEREQAVEKLEALMAADTGEFPERAEAQTLLDTLKR